MSRFCEQCGLPLGIGVRFCEGCGYSVAPKAAAAASGAVAPAPGIHAVQRPAISIQPKPAAAMHDGSKQRVGLIAGLVILVLIIVAGTGYYFWKSPPKRVGTMLPSPTRTRNPASPTPLAALRGTPDIGPRWPWTAERLLSESDLQVLGTRELDLMRNEIYARHGWVFKRQDLQQYFLSQPWYRPKGSPANRAEANRLAAAELSPVEKRNVQIIQLYEKAHR